MSNLKVKKVSFLRGTYSFVLEIAQEQAISQNCIIEGKINDVVVQVAPDSNIEHLVRDLMRFDIGLVQFDKIGPYPNELSKSTIKEEKKLEKKLFCVSEYLKQYKQNLQVIQRLNFAEQVDALQTPKELESFGQTSVKEFIVSDCVEDIDFGDLVKVFSLTWAKLVAGGSSESISEALELAKIVFGFSSEMLVEESTVLLQNKNFFSPI